LNFIQNTDRICIIPELHGVGGMVTFQKKFSKGLAERNIGFTYDLDDRPYQSILVIGGTKNITGLIHARSEGIPIVQRLDGINWLHRVRLRKNIRDFNARTFIRAEYGNRILFLIRERLANSIIYQSEFVRNWWLNARGSIKATDVVIHNGVSLDTYKPLKTIQRPENRTRILLVEGNLMGGYEAGLEVVVKLITMLLKSKVADLVKNIELVIVGKVSDIIRDRWTVELNKKNYGDQVSVKWMGVVPLDNIPELNNQAHFLYSSDINAACPNSVIEAMACGNPVLSFDTGAIPELVSTSAGKIVPYGSDPWKLETPDIKALALGALNLVKNQKEFRSGARKRAERHFGLDRMLDSYLDILAG
jgi:glycosyltransferase involved in cell wall biosynthesis